MTNIEVIMQAVLKEAEERKRDAGFAGEMGDRGANLLEMQVKFYQYGMQGKVPFEWRDYAWKVNQAMMEQDPDYKAMLELQNKLKQKYNVD